MIQPEEYFLQEAICSFGWYSMRQSPCINIDEAGTQCPTEDNNHVIHRDEGVLKVMPSPSKRWA